MTDVARMIISSLILSEVRNLNILKISTYRINVNINWETTFTIVRKKSNCGTWRDIAPPGISRA
jgi:hypothetical protein